MAVNFDAGADTLATAMSPRRMALTASPRWRFGAVVVLLLVAIVAAAQFGAVAVQAVDWLAPWAWWADGAEAPGGSAHVLWQLRLPRVVFAMAIGATLGLTGALTQGLFRNPLADPSLLGVTGGAACAAALVIVLFGAAQMPLPIAWRPYLLPAAAFAGALAVCAVLDRVARWVAPGSIAGLLLTGVALNAIAASVIGLCTYLADDEQLRNLSFWTLGSVAAGSWALDATLLLLLVLAAWRARSLAKALNALALGEAAAGHVGVDVARLRGHAIVLVAVLSGFAVAWCGMIAFLGLLAPHFARMLVGADQRRLMPMAMAVGALILLLADTLARTVAVPAEIPVGIFTALLGGPGFLALLAGVARKRGALQ